MTKGHEATLIAPDTWRICEGGWVNCYLLTGDDRALLIDTGNGIGDLGAAVRKLTDLPVTVTLTHRHCDHANGRGWFRSSCHIHEADMSLTCAISSSRIASRALAAKWTQRSDYPRQPCHPGYTAIPEGAVFDLGGREVSVIHTPGHTAGSVVYLDERERLMFTGDDVMTGVWLWLPGSLSVEEWLSGAKRILALTEEYTPWPGHGDEPQTREGIAEIIAAGEELVGRTRHNALFSGKRYYPDEENALITYRTGNVRKKR